MRIRLLPRLRKTVCSLTAFGRGCGMNLRDAELVWEILGVKKMVLTVDDMVRITGESDDTIRRRVDAGEIRSSTRRDCRGIRIPLSEVLRYCMV